jgi:exosome complex component RRP4
MAITILSPAPPPPISHEAHSDDDDDMDLDSDEDVDMGTGRPAYKKPRVSRKHVVTPGELVTDDTQWMRFVIIPPHARVPSILT